jgi:hypothetical protein
MGAMGAMGAKALSPLDSQVVSLCLIQLMIQLYLFLFCMAARSSGSSSKTKGSSFAPIAPFAPISAADLGKEKMSDSLCTERLVSFRVSPPPIGAMGAMGAE